MCAALAIGFFYRAHSASRFLLWIFYSSLGSKPKTTSLQKAMRRCAGFARIVFPCCPKKRPIRLNPWQNTIEKPWACQQTVFVNGGEKVRTKQKRQRMSALLSAGTAAASLKHSAALPHGAIRKLKFSDSPAKITTWIFRLRLPNFQYFVYFFALFHLLLL